jgi:hypothetical protein
MKTGDVVRVTSVKYPNTAVEGVVEYINNKVSSGYIHVDIRGMWNNTFTFSSEHFDFKVIRAVEPDEIGSTLIDKEDTTWTKYSNDRTLKWINEYGVKADWQYVCNLISH